MITGAHAIISSTNCDADRAFLRDVLGFPHVDVGGGWLIFGLPPSEVAVHPSETNGAHVLYLMTDDVEGFVADMQGRGLACDAITNQGWGMLTAVALPGGGKLGVYQPRHAIPPPATVKAKPAAKKPATKKPATKKSAAKKSAAKKPAAKRAAKKKPARRRR